MRDNAGLYRMYLKELLEIAEKERTPIGGDSWDDLKRILLDANKTHSEKMVQDIERGESESFS